jgi:integrase
VHERERVSELACFGWEKHDFRRTFAGNLWDAKIDGVTIQKLMGHALQNQTTKYDGRLEATLRQPAKVLHVRDRSKSK